MAKNHERLRIAIQSLLLFFIHNDKNKDNMGKLIPIFCASLFYALPWKSGNQSVIEFDSDRQLYIYIIWCFLNISYYKVTNADGSIKLYLFCLP